MRCPECGGLDTIRRGRARSAPIAPQGALKPLQRFSCNCCGTTFSSQRKKASPRARFSDDFKLEVVRHYIQGLTSYRRLSAMREQVRGWPASRNTLNDWVQEIGERAKTPLDLSRELKPSWSRFLGVDGKAIYVWPHHEHCLMICVDQSTYDIPHALVLDSESADGFARLLTEARLDAGHDFEGVVADAGGGKAFAGIYRDHFGNLPLQACRVHFDRRLDRDIPRSKWSPTAPLRQELKDRVRAVLYAPTYEHAWELFNALFRERQRYAEIKKHGPIQALRRDFDLYMAHHRVPGLPADNNITENVIRQLNAKLRLMQAFESLESAERYVRLLIGCYRFKRFTDSRNGHNGRSPLEIAGVDVKDRDWLTFLIDR